MSIVVLGSISMDLTTYVPRLPAPGETLFGSHFITVPGGKGFNQALAAARLGADTRFVGRLGDDTFGAGVREFLEKESLDISNLITDPENASGLAVISVDEAAENSIIVISGTNANGHVGIQVVSTNPQDATAEPEVDTSDAQPTSKAISDALTLVDEYLVENQGEEGTRVTLMKWLSS